MKAFYENLRAMLKAARYALWQQEVAVPDYWDGARTTAVRCALLALVLFAGVLLVRLCVLLVRKKRDLRAIIAFALTLGVVLGMSFWAFQPMPLVEAGAVTDVTLSRVEDRSEETVRLTGAQRQAVTALLEEASCRRGFETALPENEGTAYRILFETKDGETAVWVSEKGGVRYMSLEKGLLYPIVSAGALYDALAAL